jgi:hypothetical protein
VRLQPCPFAKSAKSNGWFLSLLLLQRGAPGDISLAMHSCFMHGLFLPAPGVYPHLDLQHAPPPQSWAVRQHMDFDTLAPAVLPGMTQARPIICSTGIQLIAMHTKCPCHWKPGRMWQSAVPQLHLSAATTCLANAVLGIGAQASLLR